jgi:FHS family L-fucose permease-like MFS transporter
MSVDSLTQNGGGILVLDPEKNEVHSSQQPQTQKNIKDSKDGLLLATICITALFFIWAFVTNLIDPLVKSVKVIYTLSDLEAQLTQFAFFIGYGVASIPAGAYLARKGYANSIVVGLGVVVSGCVIAGMTTFSHLYITVLIGLFVAASGIALLQVAANPLIASMGDPKLSAFRLNFSQAFNSMGAYLGGLFGARFLLQGPLFKHDIVITDAMKSAGLVFVTNVYFELAAALSAFTLGAFFLRKAISRHSPKLIAHTESPFSALSSKWGALGSLAIFLYVGAEVCVISGMLFFLEQKHIFNIPAQVAGYISPIFMLFAMIGRFCGSALLRKFKATTMLTFVATGAALLCIVVIATNHITATPLGGTFTFPGNYVAPITMGFIPGCAALLIGLFNSIMFPTIFTVTLERSSAPASATSGLMCMAICGGGFISVLYGAAVDFFTKIDPYSARAMAFIVPLVCYLYVFWFTRAARKAPVHQIEEGVASAH